MQDLTARAQHIRLLVLDVDGVLTDGGLFFGDDGQEYKMFNSRDGHGMRMLQDAGIPIAIITGRQSEVVKHRMENLGVAHVYQGQREKLPAFEALLKEAGLAAEQVAYVGDDVVDLPILTRVGLAIAVQDAHTLVKQHAHWTTPQGGGRGAVRDVCELIMQAQGSLDAALGHYLQ
jgi:3-deoxy-D-manno-octulosonate 8-phosphate phosphatase (KDO 8-P phosphatase)